MAAGRTLHDRPPLAEVGLERGERVRFRRRDGEHWTEATVRGREKDGSIALTDGRGAARAIPLDQLEVRRTGRRGGAVWVPVVDIARRTEQLTLW